jgi:hypothetical protein
MLRRLPHILMTLLAWTLAAGLSQAEIWTVETTGQAVATGAASDAHLRKRALQEALYQAALKGGAQVSGYSALSHSVLSTDVLVIRPDAKILDYSVISDKTTKAMSQITIRAVVGSLDETPACARRAVLHITQMPPQVSLAVQAPAWLNDVQARVGQALGQSLNAQGGITSQTALAGAPAQNSTLADEYSYVALTQGAAARAAPAPTGPVLQTVIAIGAPDTSGSHKILPVTLHLSLRDPSKASPAIQRRETLGIKLRATTPWRALNARSIAGRDAVIAQITEAATQMVREMTETSACQPLAGPLTLASGVLHLPFGRKDGLTTHHLAYTQGRDTPYQILEITKLADHSVELRPLDRTRPAAQMAGLTVQFMELK